MEWGVLEKRRPTRFLVRRPTEEMSVSKESGEFTGSKNTIVYKYFS